VYAVACSAMICRRVLPAQPGATEALTEEFSDADALGAAARRGADCLSRRHDRGRRSDRHATRACAAACHHGRVPRRLLILGSTGSIGTQALEIVARDPELELVGLSAERSSDALIEQARRFGVDRIALADVDAGARAAEQWTDGEVLAGAEGLVKLVLESGADLVLNALVGSAGLGPTVATLGEGIDLALANKESLVVGGELVMALAEATGAQILPVDSEHSALHQLLAGEGAGGTTSVEKLVLTASGGPFRGRRRAELEDVSVEDALAHPTWDMGGKISIDSATLMNKGLEVIEAYHLFGIPYERIDVVVHPQSIVHSMITLIDGAALAHLGHPDMGVPISYALHYPDRVDVPVRRLDLTEVGALTFEPVDHEAFPCLGLARAAAVAGGTAPCVLNAANEIAVHAFLRGELGFLGIAAVIERTLEQLAPAPVRAFESLYEADREARAIAAELVQAESDRLAH
jgi:1-deoxy-D-xylulose-5-phosphate reductoisomerase